MGEISEIDYERIEKMIREVVREELSKFNYPLVSGKEMDQIERLHGSVLSEPKDKSDYTKL